MGMGSEKGMSNAIVETRFSAKEILVAILTARLKLELYAGKNILTIYVTNTFLN